MVILYGFVTAAVIMDLRFRKISNRLILTGLCMGLIRRLLLEGSAGLSAGVIHILLPVIFLYLLFWIGVLGAGDIKLFSLIGGFVNLRELTTCVMAAFVIGGIWSFLKLALKGFKLKEEEHTIPFSVAIMGGLLIATLC